MIDGLGNFFEKCDISCAQNNHRGGVMRVWDATVNKVEEAGSGLFYIKLDGVERKSGRKVTISYVSIDTPGYPDEYRVVIRESILGNTIVSVFASVLSGAEGVRAFLVWPKKY